MGGQRVDGGNRQVHGANAADLGRGDAWAFSVDFDHLSLDPEGALRHVEVTDAQPQELAEAGVTPEIFGSCYGNASHIFATFRASPVPPAPLFRMASRCRNGRAAQVRQTLDASRIRCVTACERVPLAPLWGFAAWDSIPLPIPLSGRIDRA